MQKKYFSKKLLVFLGVVAWLALVLSACGTAGAPQDSGQNQDLGETPNVSDADTPSTNDGARGEGAPNQGQDGEQGAPMENEAFRVTQPRANDIIGMSVKVEGEARVFEGNFYYTLEDGHSILAEGVGQAEKGAPEWGPFTLEIQLQEAPTSPHGMLILYEESAKDKTPVNELLVPLTFDEKIVKPVGAE